MKPTPRSHQGRGPGYASQPGDARRQGRVDRAAAHAVRGAADEIVEFRERGARIDVLRGVIVVGEITLNPTGGRLEFLWSCFLPMTGRSCQPAESMDKAKDAVAFKVREWCDAAGLRKAAAR